FKDINLTQPYPAGTTFHATLEAGTTSELRDANLNTIATCTASTIDGLTENKTGQIVTANVLKEGVTWGGCSQFTATTAGGDLDIEANGDVTGTGFGVTFAIFGVTCTYGFGTGSLLGTIFGGSAPILYISTTVQKVAGGFLCPSYARWDANYAITSPESL